MSMITFIGLPTEYNYRTNQPISFNINIARPTGNNQMYIDIDARGNGIVNPPFVLINETTSLSSINRTVNIPAARIHNNSSIIHILYDVVAVPTNQHEGGHRDINVHSFAPLAPTNLQPTTQQVRTSPITISWQHNARPASQTGNVVDPHISSEIEIRQGGGGTEQNITLIGNVTQYTIPANTFTTDAAVSFRVRTEGGNGAGYSPWSAEVSFTLVAIFPPQAPTNLQPTTRQNPTRQIQLTWNHVPAATGLSDSQDGYEARIRRNIADTWVIMPGEFGNRLTLVADTFPSNQTQFQFQARTKGLRGGWGPWSEIVTVPLGLDPPLVPTNLSPESGTSVNWQRHNTISWRHNSNPALWEAQSESEVEFEYFEYTPFDLIHHQVSYFPGTSNRMDFSPGTLPFNVNAFGHLESIYWRVRTKGINNGWSPWTQQHELGLFVLLPLAPTNLQPDLLNPQNPRGIIRTSWTHNPHPEERNAEQTGSQIRVRQANSAWRYLDGTAENVIEIPAGFFVSYALVEWQARTSVAIGGYGEWSEIERFDLRMTPPLPPFLTHPVNTAVRASQGVFLQWSYNSPYDVFPSRFDVEYRFADDDNYTTITTVSAGGLPAPPNATTRSEVNQSWGEWRVRAWGEHGDVGDWSSYARFFIIGIPPLPAIVEITNSARPKITFSATNPMAWEIEIFTEVGGEESIVYSTGERAFAGIFSHIVEDFIPNGEYTARLRISNEYGVKSEWTEADFEIDVSAPNPIPLDSIEVIRFALRLNFNGIGRTGFVYRTTLIPNEKTPPYNPVALVEDVNYWEDWTIRPGVEYSYFIRAFDTQTFAFTDYPALHEKIDFVETVISIANKPTELITLMWQIDEPPTKNLDFGIDKQLTHMAGREKPVIQVGIHTTRTATLYFYVKIIERDRLEVMARSGEVLLLRDSRLGVIYGTITGDLSAISDGLGGGLYEGHTKVSFTFTECDYSEDFSLAVV